LSIKQISSAAELGQLLDKIVGRQVPIWIKVNWTSPHEGMYTDPQVIREFLGALSRPVLLLESYSVGRIEGPIKELPEDEDEYINAHREADRKFLTSTGYKEIMDMTGVGYLNVTEATASSEIAPTDEVKEIVESQFEPVRFTELYSQIPRALYSQRKKGVLVNLARMKIPASDGDDWSLAFKNMFGLIPLPNRMPYHERSLVDAILDINTIYRSLFRVVDFIEGLQNVVVYGDDGEHRVPWGNYDLQKNKRLLAFGEDPTELELEIADYFGRDLSDRTLIKRAQRRFSR